MDSSRLARYLAGEASSADRAQIEAWAEADGANAAELARLQAGWSRTQPLHTWDVEGAWQKVRLRIRSPTAPAEITPVGRRYAPWLAAAAVLLAVIGVGGWWLARGRLTVYATEVGEQRSVTLADGSEVALAPATRLVVGRSFGRSDREVELEGHAWFAVRHDEHRPFRVVTERTVIEDLGTEFTVETHGSFVQVAVMSGSVSVRPAEAPPSEAVTLGPRDVATVQPDATPRVTREVAVERIAGWRQGTLAFDNQPLRVILNELERWYPVEFAPPDPSFADQHLFVTLPTNDLSDAIGTIAAALGATVRRSGDVVAFVPRGRP